MRRGHRPVIRHRPHSTRTTLPMLFARSSVCRPVVDRVHARAAAAVYVSAIPWRRTLANAAATSTTGSDQLTNTTQTNSTTPSAVPRPSSSHTDRVHEVSEFLDRASTLELPRPGSVTPRTVTPEYRPLKPLPKRIQNKIDLKLPHLRRREHPEWLEKPFVRKMTLQERQKLVRPTQRHHHHHTLSSHRGENQTHSVF